MKITFIVAELVSDRTQIAEVNAALLSTVLAAYPEAEVHYLAASRQAAAVSSEMKRHGLRELAFHHLPDIPDSNRFRAHLWNLNAFFKLRSLVAKHDATHLLLSSLDSTRYKYFSITRPAPDTVKCAGFAHDASTPFRLERSGLGGRLLSIFSQTRVQHMRLVALGPAGASMLEESGATWNAPPCWINMPYLYPADSEPRDLPSANISFFFLGGSREEKGFHHFCDFTRRFADKSEFGSPRFVLLGKLSWIPDNYSADLPIHVPGAGGRVARDEYASLARSAHYAVMPSDAVRYAKMASASICDTIAYRIPLIALDVPAVRRFFDQFGDIGYCCQSPDEIARTIESILHDPPGERYMQQQQRLSEAAHALSPENQAERFRAIWE